MFNEMISWPLLKRVRAKYTGCAVSCSDFDHFHRPHAMPLQALVFDAYGTLFDVHSVIDACERLWPGKGEALSRAWRAKQLEYTWLRSMMGRYTDFACVTEDALGHACTSLGLELSGGDKKSLMDAYLHLAPYADATQTLPALSGRPLAILSNGSPAMLAPLVRNAGMEKTFAAVLSVDALRTYKPAPAVYQLAVDTLGLPKESIGFVSSNCWDACGAKAFGFRVFWINRSRAPLDAIDVVPDHIIHSLAQLPALLALLT